MAIRFEYGPPPSALGALAYQSGVQQAQDRRRREIEALQVQAAQMRQQRQQANLDRQFSAWKTQYGHDSAMTRMKSEYEYRGAEQEKGFTQQKELSEFEIAQRRRESLASNLVAMEQKRLEAERSQQADQVKMIQTQSNKLEHELIGTFNARGWEKVKQLRKQRDLLLADPKASPQEKLKARTTYYQGFQKLTADLANTEPLTEHDVGFEEPLGNGLLKKRMPDGSWAIFPDPNATDAELELKIVNGKERHLKFNASDGRFLGYELKDPGEGKKPTDKMTMANADKALFQTVDEEVQVGEEIRKQKKTDYTDHGRMMADLYKRSVRARPHWDPKRSGKDYEDFLQWYQGREAALEEANERAGRMDAAAGEPGWDMGGRGGLPPAAGEPLAAGGPLPGQEEPLAAGGEPQGGLFGGIAQGVAAGQGFLDRLQGQGQEQQQHQAQQQKAWESVNQTIANVEQEFGERATPELAALLQRARAMQNAPIAELIELSEELKAEIETARKVGFNQMEDEFRGIV